MNLRDRMLYGAIRRSERFARLTFFQRDLFYGLLNVCDDYGRFDADPKGLRVALYGPCLSKVSWKDIQLALVPLHEQGLVRLYTGNDGRGYGEIRKFRQRLMRRNAEHPAPSEATEAASLFDEPDPPPEELAFASAFSGEPDNRREEKREKGKRAKRAALSLSGKVMDEPLEQWAERLRQQYPSLDLLAQERACRRYCEKNHKVFERAYFERWLKTSSETIDRPIFKPSTARPKSTENPSAPEGWQAVIAETNYGPDGAFAVGSFEELPDDVQKWVRDQVSKR